MNDNGVELMDYRLSQKARRRQKFERKQQDRRRRFDDDNYTQEVTNDQLEQIKAKAGW